MLESIKESDKLNQIRGGMMGRLNQLRKGRIPSVWVIVD